MERGIGDGILESGKHIKGKTVGIHIKSGVWLIGRYKCCFLSFYKCTTIMYNVNNNRAWVRDIQEISVLFHKFSQNLVLFKNKSSFKTSEQYGGS